jgi:hypothetical protein
VRRVAQMARWSGSMLLGALGYCGHWLEQVEGSRSLWSCCLQVECPALHRGGFQAWELTLQSGQSYASTQLLLPLPQQESLPFRAFKDTVH